MARMRSAKLSWRITTLLILCFFGMVAEGKYGGGSGTPEEPHQIWDANHMQAIGANSDDWDKHFILMSDIDLAQFDGKDGREAFNVIGDRDARFAGVFDGKDYTISNFTYDSTERDYIGLFGQVHGEGAEIKNLLLTNPSIDGGTGNYVGSLVGDLSMGSIVNCQVEGSEVSGDGFLGGLCGTNSYGTISNCCATVTISGGVSGDSTIGGLCGYNNSAGNINNCYASGVIFGEDGDSTLGGLCGTNDGSINECYATTAISGYLHCTVGGLCGYNDGSIRDCYATGAVSGDEHDSDRIGGLCGENEGSISNCYAIGAVSGGVGI